ncbi:MULTISPECIES: multidrug efflux RND transporter permease subunit [unclassified Pseudomonas]|uniref:multidrug efflux RND transporter permease subunit n=1 Tax=unclassified Pseudomonas TaxID=196821 RepID=UPI002AC991C1|nr:MULTISPECIES: multidrug efflux RND transporter permease subunit [unclassified Pseudomonas]MEB0040886.1 multidrug efflux RND transporter permease subunit [Pseudomonas sp. MH10]MEB0119449.1 multidrug efflux RND transporter permease subunit [Pseudomonas sp. CCI1.2]WPX65781.1 multidrug efflux RND transporter permease subunit [Pseudomonas sp. MH10]
MSAYFIARPVMAWVIAILILLGGGFAATRLSVEQYPNVAPPRVSIEASYPGASPQVAERTVTAVIERELNGIAGLLYFTSTSAEGRAEINLSFETGTDTKLAAIDVQNRIKRVEERLPESVRRQGLKVEQSGENQLLFVTLTADNPSVDDIQLGDFATSIIRPALLRVPGVGEVGVYSPEYAMRIWADVHKLTAMGVTTQDLISAITLQNQRITLGSIGTLPATPDTPITAPLAVEEDLDTPQAFGDISLRVNSDGSALRVADVARVELGGNNYNYPAFVNGKYCGAISVRLATGANALSTAEAIKSKLDEMSAQFPPGVRYQTAFDTSTFVKLSIAKVGYTLIEAMVLVFLVMWLFLRSWRATLIPSLVVPIALAGTCGVMYALGFSINVLTLFGMVLAIGILVDDAIVVVENVERIMHEEGLPPREATLKAMQQISGAIVAITLVLTAVFIPMALFQGAVGEIYRQFSVALAVPMALSAFLALTFTPALCASLLKPVKHTPIPDRLTRRSMALAGAYLRGLDGFLNRPKRFMLLYVGLLGIVALLFWQLPGAFLPSEDKGNFATVIMLPTGSTQADTREVVDEVQAYLRTDSSIDSLFAMQGFSYFGDGQNTAMVWPSLTDWSLRKQPEQQINAILARLNQHFAQGTEAHPKALVKALNTPPLPSMGRSEGIDLRLQDRAGLGHDALMDAKDQLLALAAKNPVLADVSFSGQSDSPQLRVSIDRRKAQSMGVPLDEINQTLATLYGSQYLGDFIYKNQVKQILVQAESKDRQLSDSLLQARVRNTHGDMVPLSTFVSMRWSVGALEIDNFNGFPALSISGTPAPGYSTTQAMDALAGLVTQLPVGFGYEWAGQSYQERVSGNQMPLLFGLSILVIFLCLAALYESWSMPLAVILAIPLGVIGALLATTLRGLPDDLYFKVGMITIIGLSAKNAILIIEVAQTLHQQRASIRQAVLDAARMRLRPIVMTSLAFMFGVLPLMLATGPGSASQRAIGTSVFGGMLSATVLTLFFVPLLYSLVVYVREFRRTPKTVISPSQILPKNVP